ncbi:hypothetical protein ACNO7T_08865 [Vibrio campbellii]
MAKSKIARQSEAIKHVRNNQSIIPLDLTIPYKDSKLTKAKLFGVSHLVHLGCSTDNKKKDCRAIFIRRFCKKAHQHVAHGKSACTVTATYEKLRSYIAFCDAVNVDPFTEGGYLKFVGNDGELRKKIKMFNDSKRLWEYSHGDELGIKEATAASIVASIRNALDWCGLPVSTWAVLHRGYAGEKKSYRGYSDAEEKLLVARLSHLFFTLAPVLIANKENNTLLPETIPLTIPLGEYEELISIPTSLEALNPQRNKNGRAVNSGAAINLTMGAAYHLMCFFTSLNDSNIRKVSHPITIHKEVRDKSLEVIKVSSYKPRSSKEVDALLVGEEFDVDKRDGVKFIKLLEQLSKLYGNHEDGSELIFTLNNKAEVSDIFDLPKINRKLVNQLHLLSPYRSSNLPWFKELFYAYRNQQTIILKKTVNHLGRTVVHKEVQAIAKAPSGRGATNSAYCILSCYTDSPLKGILLPLTYSEKDSNGNITVSFNYRNGIGGFFKVPASDLTIIKDIEKYAKDKADKQPKKYERLLLAKSNRNTPNNWKGCSPISSELMRTWSIETSHYYLPLQSSRWREMTSHQAYAEGGIQRAQSLLQNTVDTLNKNYINGHPLLNKLIIFQALQVIQKIDNEIDLEHAKNIVVKKLGIPMLSHDEWKKKHTTGSAKTTPNGLTCDGQQIISGGKNTQQETNRAVGIALPCAEFDMCYKCQSAKAVDDVEAVYKLISYIDALKESLDMYPDSTGNIHDKIEQFEYTLDGASETVFDGAMTRFNTQGRHPRVSIEYAILAL